MPNKRKAGKERLKELMSTSTKKLVPVGLCLDANELASLKEAAMREGRSLSSYVRRTFFGEGRITAANPTKKPRK